ncbi:MAG: hypothetical protein CMM52_13650 [Rhodospirillaceae bacterium]|nr:hypothetical protein [Rhodospirillaceae bacterium]|tara:strand:- start:22437 stop:23126 length:690 start_codon:yes stop_codon:yes gene_type:complete
MKVLLRLPVYTLIASLCATSVVEFSAAQSSRTTSSKYERLVSPVSGHWYTLLGPPCPSANNHHCKINSQKFAYDFIKLDKKGQPTSCLGEIVKSPTNGTVVAAVDHFPNKAKGKRTAANTHPAGNHIVIHRRANEFVILAHLSPHTFQVRLGQGIKAGDPLAECGNSGRASASHLHIHMQSSKEPLDFTSRGLPMVFTRVGVVTKKGCRSRKFYIFKVKDIHCEPTRFQ